ncbi:MAG TPA: hypothetical protein VGA69_10445 [Nitriliruptorales bacterium]
MTRERGHEITDAYEVVEIYTDAPAAYADEDGSIAWHVVASPGKLGVGRGDLPSPNVRITMTYDTVLPLMRIVIADDDDVRARIAQVTGAAQADGRMRVEVLGPARPSNPLGSAFHDGVAAVTA